MRYSENGVLGITGQAIELSKRQPFKMIPIFASLATYVLAFSSWYYIGRV